MTIEQVPLVEVRTASGRKSRKNLGPSEAQLLAAVRRLARYRGFMTYHTRDSRGSEAGFPDLVMVSARQRRLLFVELKTATGKTSTAQDAWIADLTAAGAETYLWRPTDLQHVIPRALSANGPGRTARILVDDPDAAAEALRECMTPDGLRRLVLLLAD